MKYPINSFNSKHGASKPTCIFHVRDYLVVVDEDNRLQIEKVVLKMMLLKNCSRIKVLIRHGMVFPWPFASPCNLLIPPLHS